jgi:hypothetical protein
LKKKIRDPRNHTGLVPANNSNGGVTLHARAAKQTAAHNAILSLPNRTLTYN